MVLHTFNSNICEAEAGESLSLRQPGLHSKFPDSQGQIYKETLSQKLKVNN